HLEQLNSEIFALLSTIFSRLKMEHLIKQIGIKTRFLVNKKGPCGPFEYHDYLVYARGISESVV
ncbi:hypothetical protein C3B51_20055, partial [Pseudoalteromonas rubra]